MTALLIDLQRSYKMVLNGYTINTSIKNEPNFFSYYIMIPIFLKESYI